MERMLRKTLAAVRGGDDGKPSEARTAEARLGPRMDGDRGAAGHQDGANTDVGAGALVSDFNSPLPTNTAGATGTREIWTVRALRYDKDRRYIST